MNQLSPVLEVAGREISDGSPGIVTQRLQKLFAEKTTAEGEALPL